MKTLKIATMVVWRIVRPIVLIPLFPLCAVMALLIGGMNDLFWCVDAKERCLWDYTPRVCCEVLRKKMQQVIREERAKINTRDSSDENTLLRPV